MKNLSWNKEGTVGIISIPQKRTNGKDRTLGFIQALEEDNIKVSGMYQQVDFSYEETYNYSKKLIIRLYLYPLYPASIKKILRNTVTKL